VLPLSDVDTQGPGFRVFVLEDEAAGLGGGNATADSSDGPGKNDSSKQMQRKELNNATHGIIGADVMRTNATLLPP